MNRKKRQLLNVLRTQSDLKMELQQPPIIGYFDGCCEPKNPGGNMGIGATFRCEGQEIFKHSSFVKQASNNTNNIAEYMAFEQLLDWLEANKICDRKIHICGDSKLVICQMLGQWKMNGGYYIPYARRCKEKLAQLREKNKLSFTLQWVPREQNHYADELSKAQLIDNGVEFRIQPLSLDHSK